MQHLVDIIEGVLVVHNDWLSSYLSKNSIYQNRSRGKFVVIESFNTYDSVLKTYAKSEVFAKLPKKEALLNEVMQRLQAEKALTEKIEILANSTEKVLFENIQRLFENFKRQFYTKDLSYLVSKLGKTEKAKDLANIATCYSLLASVKGKLSVKALDIKGLETKGQLTESLYQIGKQEGWLDMSKGWFEVRACEFKELLADSREEALSSLIHGNTANSNAAKLANNDLAKAVLLSLWVNKGTDVKHSEAWIVETYNALANGNTSLIDETTGELIGANSNLPVLSENTIRNFLNMPYNKAIYSKYRHGSKYYKDTYRPYVLGLLPRYSFTMCSLDGFTMPFVRKRANSKESAFKRFKCVMVFDVATQAIVGCSWGMSESKDLFKAAINQMLRLYKIIPLEIQQDNAARFLQNEYLTPIDNTGDLKSIFPFVTFPEPYNAQAKPVERYLGMFDQEVLRNQKGWMGKNIKGTKSVESMRNEDFKPYAYTDEEFEQCLAEWVNTWNNAIKKNGKSRIQNCLAQINPETQIVNNDILYTFCSQETKRQIKNGFVHLEYNGKEYTYLVEDYAGVLAQIKYNRVRVRFLPEKLNTEIAIYAMVEEDNSSLDKFLCYCQEAKTVQRAKGEQIEQDKKNLALYEQRKKSFDKIVEAENEKLMLLSKKIESPLNEEVALDESEAFIKKFMLLSKQVENPLNEDMTLDEAEAVLQSGYTDKKTMEQAEEVIAQKSINKKLLEKINLYK